MLINLSKKIADIWKYITKKSAYPYEHFNSTDEYQKPVDNLKKENFFSKLKNKCPSVKKTNNGCY